MFRVNLTYRFTLITPDEVIAKLPSSHTLDPKRILSAIEIGEERFIKNAICRSFYEKLICEKNKDVTADNLAELKEKVTESLSAEEAEKLVVGDIINSESFLTEANKKLWRRYLWKLTAEAVYLIALPENYAKLTSEGIVKSNPEVPIASAGTGESVGIKLHDLKALMSIGMNNRVDPLISSMHEWICDHKKDYPLYCKKCDCDTDGVSANRKTSIALGIYDQEFDENGCIEKSCDDAENSYPCD